MTDNFLSLTEIGRHYGVSSHKVGRWLVDLGLRNEKKKPSVMAFDGGYVTQRDSTQPGTYYWTWHAEKTMQLLDQVGKKRVAEPQATT